MHVRCWHNLKSAGIGFHHIRSVISAVSNDILEWTREIVQDRHNVLDNFTKVQRFPLKKCAGQEGGHFWETVAEHRA